MLSVRHLCLVSELIYEGMDVGLPVSSTVWAYRQIPAFRCNFVFHRNVFCINVHSALQPTIPPSASSPPSGSQISYNLSKTTLEFQTSSKLVAYHKHFVEDLSESLYFYDTPRNNVGTFFQEGLRFQLPLDQFITAELRKTLTRKLQWSTDTLSAFSSVSSQSSRACSYYHAEETHST